MFHLDNKSGVSVMPTLPDEFSSAELFFTEGGGGVNPSWPGAAWFNIVQSELLNVVKAAGLNPEKHSLNQITLALKTMFASRPELIDPDGAIKYPELQIARWRDTGDVRGWGAVPGGVTLCDVFFQDAEAANKAVYVPAGNWRLSTPMILGQTAQYYGPGVLVFDNAEQWRRGGSSGDVSVREKYTLMYDYPDKDAVSITFDGVSAPFTWIDDRTIEAAGTTLTTNVKINIAKGFLRLGPNPEMIRSFNLVLNGGGAEKLAPALPDPLTSPVGYDNVSAGPRAMMDMESGVNNTAIGSKALMSNKVGNNNTGIGFLALYRSLSQGNTALGSVALEWLDTGYFNTALGMASSQKLRDGSFNVSIGYQSMYEAMSTQYTVAIGYRANGNTGSYSQSNSVYVGSFAGDFNIGSNNTMVGYRAGNCLDGATNPRTGSGHDNVGVGMFAMRRNMDGSESVVIGAGAATEATRVNGAVVIGYAAAGATVTMGDYTVAIGHSCLKNGTGTNNVGVGQQALLATTSGTGNTGVGTSALVTNQTGSNNTSLGHLSGRLKQDGTSTVSLNNTLTLGYDARVSGDNQNQIGNSSSTTYVFGTVQNRSDARDKADVRDTQLGIDFIMGLRPVDGRWDMRDDYIDIVEKTRIVQVPVEKQSTLIDADGQPIITMVMEDVEETYPEAVQRERDGSMKRTRFHHWFIAQEVEELCTKLNIEFGGLQHHAVTGGEDKYTLGYDEFIPPVVSAIQSCWTKLSQLEERIAAIEAAGR